VTRTTGVLATSCRAREGVIEVVGFDDGAIEDLAPAAQ